MKKFHAVALAAILATAGILTSPINPVHAQQQTPKPKGTKTPTVTPDSIPPICPPSQPDCEF